MTPDEITSKSLVNEWSTPPEDLINPGNVEVSNAKHVRKPGRLILVAERDGTGITRLKQSRSRMPLAIQRKISPDTTGEPGRVCVLTPGGGHLAGDRLKKTIHCRSGSHLRVEDTGMQRIYGMKPGRYCRQTVSVTVESGACLEWIPGPVIPYENSSFHDFIELDLHDDSSLFVPFLLLPGRIAHGEQSRYRYYGKRIISENSTRQKDPGDGFHGLRFSDSLTVGTSVGFTPRKPLLTLYVLLENDERNEELIDTFRKLEESYGDLTGGTSLLADDRTLVFNGSSPSWEDLVGFVNECHVEFRKAVKCSETPSPFLFTAG